MDVSFLSASVCIYRLLITTISQPTVGGTRSGMDNWPTDSSSDSWEDKIVRNTPFGAMRRQYRKDDKPESLRWQKKNRVNYIHVSLGRNR